jgi:serine phosphatase RsbU (regulator of sigma subunit)
LQEKLEELTERLRKRAASPPALDEGYWSGVRDLFTRDVTGKAFRDLQRDTRDSFGFFASEADRLALQGEAWYRRWPLLAWRFFLTVAYRLSPARRVLFAASVPLLALGWLRWFVVADEGPHVGERVLLAAGSLLFVLLVLELRDKLALKGDLEVARQIQFGLLPFEPYQKDGLSVRAAMRPANTVGGDYFDLVPLEEGRLGVVIGDVAGKGMPAALLMALLQGSLRTLVTAGLRGGELMEKLNAHLCVHIPSNRLVTLFYGELDVSRGVLSYVNGGHNAPLLVPREGALARLSATGMALGIIPEARYAPMQAELGPGDRLLLYTDGITEAFNAQDVDYGEERLEAFLRERRSLGQAELVDGLIEDVLAFCGSVRPKDDMTLLLLTREP